MVNFMLLMMDDGSGPNSFLKIISGRISNRHPKNQAADQQKKTMGKIWLAVSLQNVGGLQIWQNNNNQQQTIQNRLDNHQIRHQEVGLYSDGNGNSRTNKPINQQNNNTPFD
ncbi:hypothetical protein ACTA71_002755 [Dictyostelium dimigraforme]